ncbi:Arc family DNA-binding protein [Symbiopectobacterium sp. RP]|uniref:Arc family DNA-binding protein n=1 Tax=Symbiopectobacterium sp. RP TaxID=3248553 RepID=UPI003D2DAFD1
MARDDDKFTVHMPQGMRDKLALRAKANNRSVNAEYVQILQDALNEPLKITGFSNEAERLADRHAEQFKDVVFKTLNTMYGKDKA